MGEIQSTLGRAMQAGCVQGVVVPVSAEMAGHSVNWQVRSDNL